MPVAQVMIEQTTIGSGVGGIGVGRTPQSLSALNERVGSLGAQGIKVLTGIEHVDARCTEGGVVMLAASAAVVAGGVPDLGFLVGSGGLQFCSVQCLRLAHSMRMTNNRPVKRNQANLAASKFI